MRNILIVGAGKSTAVLIEYLLEKSQSENLTLTICDLSLETAKKLASNHPRARVLGLDVFNEEQRDAALATADIVISMLPARYHIQLAKACLHFNKHLVTASYISDEMAAL